MVKQHSGTHKKKHCNYHPQKRPLLTQKIPPTPKSVILMGTGINDTLVHAIRHSTLTGNTYVPTHLYETITGERLLVLPAGTLPERNSIDMQTYHTQIFFTDFGQRLAIVDDTQKQRRKIGKHFKSQTPLGRIVTSDKQVVLNEHKEFHLVD